VWLGHQAPFLCSALETPRLRALLASLFGTAHIIRARRPIPSEKRPAEAGLKSLGIAPFVGGLYQIVCLRRGALRSVSHMISAAIRHRRPCCNHGRPGFGDGPLQENQVEAPEMPNAHDTPRGHH